ncbi:MAG: hypothetical protein ACR2NP_00145, partial [Pirellulaceae bacterium]
TEGEFWTAELAIPLNELGDQLRREVWAISASRYLRNQLVSTCWQTADQQRPAPVAFASQHQAALNQACSSQNVPLSAVNWLVMPWQAVEKDSKTTDLPDSR